MQIRALDAFLRNTMICFHEKITEALRYQSLFFYFTIFITAIYSYTGRLNFSMFIRREKRSVVL